MFVSLNSRTCPAWKGFTKTNRRRHTGQQPGTKSASRPDDKPRINRWSTAGFVSPSVYIGFPLFVLPESRPQRLSLIRQSVRGTVLSWANRSVGVSFCPALPSLPLRRARSPVPTRPWYVRVFDSTSILCIIISLSDYFFLFIWFVVSLMLSRLLSTEKFFHISYSPASSWTDDFRCFLICLLFASFYISSLVIALYFVYYFCLFLRFIFR